MRKEVAADIRAIFNAPDKRIAEQYLQVTIENYARSAPRLSAWMEHNLAEGFTVFDFPLNPKGRSEPRTVRKVSIEKFAEEPEL